MHFIKLIFATSKHSSYSKILTMEQIPFLNLVVINLFSIRFLFELRTQQTDDECMHWMLRHFKLQIAAATLWNLKPLTLGIIHCSPATWNHNYWEQHKQQNKQEAASKCVCGWKTRKVQLPLCLAYKRKSLQNHGQRRKNLRLSALWKKISPES